MAYNPTDVRETERERQAKILAERAAADREREDFKLLMSERWGRRFVWRMLEKTGVYRTTFRTSSEMAFLEGQRNVGLMLVANIHEVCPELYVTMLNEAKEANK